MDLDNVGKFQFWIGIFLILVSIGMFYMGLRSFILVGSRAIVGDTSSDNVASSDNNQGFSSMLFLIYEAENRFYFSLIYFSITILFFFGGMGFVLNGVANGAISKMAK
jgi:hypothetical protein